MAGHPATFPSQECVTFVKRGLSQCQFPKYMCGSKDVILFMIKGVCDGHVFSQDTPSGSWAPLLYNIYHVHWPRCQGVGSLLVPRVCSFLYVLVYEFSMLILTTHVRSYTPTCTLYKYLLWLLLLWLSVCNLL